MSQEIRAAKWKKIRDNAVALGKQKEVEWMDSQASIVADIATIDIEKEVDEAVDYSGMTVDELKAALDEKEIEYDSGALKADLIALLEE